MAECRNPEASRKVVHKEDLLMENLEVRAIATYFRAFHGADSFVTALEHARTLTETGALESAPVWNQIAEEISHLETHDQLERCLKRKG